MTVLSAFPLKIEGKLKIDHAETSRQVSDVQSIARLVSA